MAESVIAARATIKCRSWLARARMGFLASSLYLSKHGLQGDGSSLGKPMSLSFNFRLAPFGQANEFKPVAGPMR